MPLKIVTADERLAEKRGVKALILGPPGVGKTSLLRTLNPERVLFLDFEAGDLAVQDVEVDQIRPTTWAECRDLACYLGGPNTVLPDDAPYSQAHFDHVVKDYGAEALEKYDTFFIDSITVAGRLCFKWCEQQPESFSDKTGNKDVRGTYGLHGREMVSWLSQLQHARAKNVIFVCLLDEVKDDFKRTHFVPQIEGSKTGRELPGIVDEVITYQVLQAEDKTYRALITSPDNEFGYPAKDRSGRLDPIEKPHLGELFAKLNDSEKQTAHAWQQDPSASLAAE